MRVLIAVDNDDPTHETLSTAKRLFPQAELIVLSAASVAPYLVTDPAGGGVYPLGAATAAIEMAEEQADLAVETAQDVLPGSTAVVETGDAGWVICSQVDELQPDVVVVGHRKMKWLSRLFDPSVSEYVVKHASCPVLVVHEPDEDDVA